MKVSGSHVVHAPRERVWEALQDPAVLVRTLPGCKRLEAVGPDAYEVTVEAGIGTIKGVYSGEVSLTDQEPPESYTLRAKGQGAPGTIDAKAQVRLVDAGDGTTRVEYDADAIVGGAIAGVGQRVLVGVAKRNAAEFFAAVDRELTGAPVAEERVAAPTAAREPARVGAVYEAPPRPPSDLPRLVAAALLGAALALLGVIVGRRTAR